MVLEDLATLDDVQVVGLNDCRCDFGQLHAGCLIMVMTMSS